MLVVGGVLYQGFDHRLAAGIVWALATLLAVGALCAPVILRGFHRLGVWLAHVAGVAMTWLTLVPVYYLVFTPIRLIGLLRGRDPLQRRRDAAAASYWTARCPIADVRHFERTY